MNYEFFCKQMALLTTHFEAKQFDEAKLAAWWDQFYFLHDEDFEKGVQKTIRTREFPDMPTLAEVLRNCFSDPCWISVRKEEYAKEQERIATELPKMLQ